MPNTRSKWSGVLLAVVAGIVGLAVGTGAFALFSPDPQATQTDSASAERQNAERESEREPGQQSDGDPDGGQTQQGSPDEANGAISGEEAGRVAVEHMGGGSVTDLYREDDYGAAWEVAVYADEGEYDVYVSAAGAVVHAD